MDGNHEIASMEPHSQFGPCFVGSCGGCSTLNTAKPLSPGQHEVAFTLGGPLTQVGGNFIPLPNSVVEGRSGLFHIAERPLDLNYGLYLTPSPLGKWGCT